MTATGVVTADGAVHHADDVIRSAGAYGSAAILLRSGIGPAADSASLGIEPRADLPVGQHLQDHPFFHTIYSLVPGRSQASPALGALLTQQIWAGCGELRVEGLAWVDTLDRGHRVRSPSSDFGRSLQGSRGDLLISGYDTLGAGPMVGPYTTLLDATPMDCRLTAFMRATLVVCSELTATSFVVGLLCRLIVALGNQLIVSE